MSHHVDRGLLLRLFLETPKEIGTIAASGRALARAVAAEVDMDVPGTIVELGAGTGALTRGLMARHPAPGRLVLVERQPALLRLLRERFATATVIDGDALDLPGIVAAAGIERIAAVVSGVPLLNLPQAARIRLIRDSVQRMSPGGRFVQITYGTTCPVSRQRLREAGITAKRAATVWLNLPPTQVWVFSRTHTPTPTPR